MRSIPLAMTWELLHRGRWQLIAAALAANAMPAVILGALELEGGFDPDDPALLIMQVVLVQMNMFIFAAAIFTSQGHLPRFYPLPITTASLVTWHFLPAMALMAVQSVLSTAALNAVFDLDWPLWGPALFAAVALVAVEATLWLTDKTGWIVLGLGLVATALGLWFKSRYGAMFSQPSHQWSHVTPVEVATLAATTVLAWGIGVMAVARNRRGDPLPALGIVAWLNRVLESGFAAEQHFRTPAEAQLWFEWRKKGWAMPAVVVVGIVFGVIGWSIFDREYTDLLEGFIAGGGILSAGAIVIGLIMGNCGRDTAGDANFEFGQFLATRPMTNTDIARTILKTAAKSVFAAWAIWAVAFLGIYLALVPTRLASLAVLDHLHWWYLPATLLGPWTIVAVGASIGMAGRSTLWLILFSFLVVWWIGLSLVIRAVLSPEAQAAFIQTSMFVCSVACVAGTVWAFLAARRRLLIGTSTVTAAACAWVTITALAVVALIVQPTATPTAYACLIGIAALAVAPLATAPLALAWNRTR